MTLIDRLSKLDGPDRHIEEEIHDLLCPGKFFSQLADAPLGAGCWMYNFPNGDVSSALHVTSSVDAAIALAERVLPGWVFDNVGQDYEGFPGGYKSFGWTVEMVNGKRVQGQAPTFPLAICIAILRAKEAN